MSIDEISQRKGHKDFATVVCDIERGKLVEVIDSHQQEEIIKVLKQQPIEVRERVEEVSVDMWGGFPKVVQEVFPNAQLVFDRFHVMKPVNEELNKVRKQTAMTVKGSKFILLKNGVDLTTSEQTKLAPILRHSQRLKLAYELKEGIRTEGSGWKVGNLTTGCGFYSLGEFVWKPLDPWHSIDSS